MKRVYVMDCGEFIKVGVSENPDKRKSQIKHKVKKYYSTEPISNAFEIEKFMHDILHPVRNNSEDGREYFNMDFGTVCEVLEKSVKSKEDDRRQIAEAISEIESTGFADKNRKFDKRFYKMIGCALSFPIEDLFFIYCIVQGLLAREEKIKNKKLNE